MKIYPKSTPFSRSDFLIGDLPSYCPSCGKEISNEKNAELEKYGTTFYCIWCIGFISFVIVLFIIFISL